MTLEEKRAAVRQVAAALEGSVRTDYSGRGMYGKTCYGITTEYPDTCVEDAASLGLRGAQRDSMGKRYIVYWPNIKGDE